MKEQFQGDIWGNKNLRSFDVSNIGLAMTSDSQNELEDTMKVSMTKEFDCSNKCGHQTDVLNTLFIFFIDRRAPKAGPLRICLPEEQTISLVNNKTAKAERIWIRLVNRGDYQRQETNESEIQRPTEI